MIPTIERAVVAARNKRGVALFYVGDWLQEELAEYDKDPEELFNTDPPDGISIWEGWIVTAGSGENCYPIGEGTFRAPDDREWEAIRSGVAPWPPLGEWHGPWEKPEFYDDGDGIGDWVPVFESGGDEHA